MSVSDDVRDVGNFWYEVVTDDSIRQGDIFQNLLVAWLPDDFPLAEQGKEEETLDKAKLQFVRSDWTVLSASCDVQPQRASADQTALIGAVLRCSPENLNNAKTDKDLRERVEILRRGFDPMRYLLAPHTSDPALELSFVYFRLQLTMPLAYLRRSAIGPRLRMKSPHRERFGNWSGECLSRVGIEDAEQVRFVKDQGIYPPQILRANPEE